MDVTRPFGSRVAITTLAGGQPFREDAEYPVAMTSYRASGGGGLMHDGAGIDTGDIDGRVISRYPEVRDILYSYLKETGAIDPAVTSDPKRIGSWKFVPEKLAAKALESDMNLLFPVRGK